MRIHLRAHPLAPITSILFFPLRLSNPSSSLCLSPKPFISLCYTPVPPSLSSSFIFLCNFPPSWQRQRDMVPIWMYVFLSFYGCLIHEQLCTEHMFRVLITCPTCVWPIHERSCKLIPGWQHREALISSCSSKDRTVNHCTEFLFSLVYTHTHLFLDMSGSCYIQKYLHNYNNI